MGMTRRASRKWRMGLRGMARAFAGFAGDSCAGMTRGDYVGMTRRASRKWRMGLRGMAGAFV